MYSSQCFQYLQARLQAREVGRGLRHVQKADAVERALELLPALLHGTGEPDTHTEKARLDAGLYLGRV